MNNGMVLKGYRYNWNGVDITVTRVARDGSWADLRCRKGTEWTKRQQLPLPDTFVRVK